MRRDLQLINWLHEQQLQSISAAVVPIWPGKEAETETEVEEFYTYMMISNLNQIFYHSKT